MKRFLLLLVLAVAPSPLFANTIYFPQVVYGSGYTTTFVINNTGTTDVTSRLNIYSQSGVLQNNVGQTLTIKAGASARYAVSTDPLGVGWAEFVAANTTVQGVATFEFRGGNGALTTAAGVLGVEAASSFLLPVDVAANTSTGIAIANTTTGTLNYRIRVINEAGAAVTSSQFALVAHGQDSKFIDEFIPGLGTTFRGTVVVETTTGTTGLALTAITKKEGLLSAVAVVPVSAGGSSRLSFPQVVIGGGFTTNFVIVNTGTTAVNALLKFYSQLGVELTQYRQTVLLPPGGSFRYSTPDSGTTTTVWADIDGGAGASLRGVGTFDYRSNGVLQTTAGVLGVAGSNVFTLPADLTATGSTGLAIGNLATNPVNVTLTLLAEDGTQSSVANDPRLNPLPALGQLAAFAEEFFPQLKGATFKGAIVIQAASGSPASTLVATALTIKEGIFSALPVIPTGPGGSGGGTGGGGGGGGGGSASDCLNVTMFNTPGTTHLEYNVSGGITGTSVSDTINTLNVAFEGNTANELSSSTTTTYSGLGTLSASAKTYVILDGTDIITFGNTASGTALGITTTSKSVFSPPWRNKQFSLAEGASDTETYTSTTTSTSTLGTTTATASITQTVKYLGRETVTVPSGTYNACKFDINNGAATSWVAAGTFGGVSVRSSSTSQGGTVILELKTGSVNGATITP